MFDKTGTLTTGTFNVVADPSRMRASMPSDVLSHAAHAEAYSDHPIAISLREAYAGEIDAARIAEAREESGPRRERARRRDGSSWSATTS